jgi:hypothetical protein
MISPEDLRLFKLTDSVGEAVEEILQFFRVYHSMRYVHEKLVLRLNQPIEESLLEELNTHFADIVTSGRIALSGPLEAERDETDLAKLPRLVFQFNRRDHGRLRHLIDCLNAGTITP